MLFGEIGNITGLIAFAAAMAYFIFSGFPRGGEGWFLALLLSAVIGASFGLWPAILTGTLPEGGGGSKAPDTISDIYRDRR